MDLGVQFRIIWDDKDLVEVRVSAWNGAFGGTSDIYVGNGELEEAGAKLSGFPRNLTDTREILLGSFDQHFVRGGVRLQFYCVDQSGHAYVDSQIESDSHFHRTIQSVLVSLPIEAAAVDRFVEGLLRIGAARSGMAFLQAVKPHDC